MPTVKVPLPSYREFKALRVADVVRDLKRRAELYAESVRVSTAISNLNKRLYPRIRKALPTDVKSFEVDGYQFSAYQGSPRETLSIPKLLEQQVKCPCGCGHRFTIPASIVEKSKVLGKVPEPVLSVREAKGSAVRTENGGGGDDDDE